MLLKLSETNNKQTFELHQKMDKIGKIEKLFLAQNCLKRSIMRIVIVTCFEGQILLWSHTSSVTGLSDELLPIT